jgi:hypothetical protein
MRTRGLSHLLAFLLLLAGCPTEDPGDDDTTSADAIDADGDGWDENVDCDDSNAALNLDDADGDGVSTCNGDCDDGAELILPGATELCDGIDNDCDGAVPDDETDDDGDGTSECEGDCNDGNASSYDGAPELCEGQDNDCDGGVDDDLAHDTYYPDEDGDGHGDAEATSETTCLPQEGWLADSSDCDDGDAAIHPDAAEACNGLDDDCDGLAGPGEVDDDGDGQWVCEGDCDDGDDAMGDGFPEVCDGLDNDCDGTEDEGTGICGDIDLSDADAKLIGEVSGDYSGDAISFAGDVNGDGFGDLFVGTHNQDEGGPARAPRTSYSARSAASSTWRTPPPSLSERTLRTTPASPSRRLVT